MTDEAATDVRQVPSISIESLPKFNRSRKGGYVEEDVDVFLDKFVTDVNVLIKELNAARLAVAERDRVIEELRSEPQNPVAQAAPVQEEAPEAIEVDDVVPAVEEPEVQTVAPTAVIDESASERAAKLFSEAQRVAEQHILDARAEAASIVAEAQQAGADYKRAIAEEVESLTQERDQIAAQADAVISRLAGLHETQLANLRESKQRIVGSITPSI